MKLPEPGQLHEPEHHLLFQHDRQEMHCREPENFTARFFKNRFEQVISAILKLQEEMNKSPQQIRILDVGCAQGNFSMTLAERGFRVTAFDLRYHFLSYGRLKYEEGHVLWVNGSLDHLPFQNGIFDVVLVTEIIEHVAHPEKLLAQLKKTARPSAFILVTTPNGSRLFTGMPTLRQISDRAGLESKQFVPDADGHLFLMTKQELREEGRKAGLRMTSHNYLGTPWVTGGMKLWGACRFLPEALRRSLDRMFLKIPFLAKAFGEGQLALFKNE